MAGGEEQGLTVLPKGIQNASAATGAAISRHRQQVLPTHSQINRAL
jgi:hypothetical protein